MRHRRRRGVRAEAAWPGHGRDGKEFGGPTHNDLLRVTAVHEERATVVLEKGGLVRLDAH